jgi:hypothetical protein
MKIIITEEQNKKLFIPRKIDEREIEYKKILDVEKQKIKNSPFGSLTKDQIFEWLQENHQDQELKLSYKGPVLGEVVMTSYNKNTGEVTLFFDTKGMDVGIKFKITDIEVGLFTTNDFEDDKFHPLD